MDLHALLSFARDNQASDLHLSAGSPPIVRLDGKLEKLNVPAMSEDDIRSILEPILTADISNRLQNEHEVDFSAELEPTTRYRINVFRQLRGTSAVFRLIPTAIRSFDDLGLPEIVKSFCLRERGLFLVTGPTGCGKSTTLAAMVDFINDNCHKHIITVEDPVEFIHQNRKCLINQREVGMHTRSFEAALRVAMREDPDVIVVGEMRDLETVSLALTAAETGHLVISTLHTSSAAKTIDRIIDIFSPESKAQVRTMLSESLAGILSQRLLPVRQGKGRVLAMEIMAATTAVRNLIREDKIYQMASIMQSGGSQGMSTLDMSLADLVRKGTIAKEEALRVASDPSKIV